MKDILLDNNGDLLISDAGDIDITDSVRQAIKVRLRWFFGEWRYAPKFGLPYFEEILVKRPAIERIRRVVRDAVMSVDEVTDVNNIDVSIDSKSRIAKIVFNAFTSNANFREEVLIGADMGYNSAWG